VQVRKAQEADVGGHEVRFYVKRALPDTISREFWVHERHLRWRHEVRLRYALWNLKWDVQVLEVLRREPNNKIAILVDGKTQCGIWRWEDSVRTRRPGIAWVLM
jgi:hypothetical protein